MFRAGTTFTAAGGSSPGGRGVEDCGEFGIKGRLAVLYWLLGVLALASPHASMAPALGTAKLYAFLLGESSAKQAELVLSTAGPTTRRGDVVRNAAMLIPSGVACRSMSPLCGKGFTIRRLGVVYASPDLPAMGCGCDCCCGGCCLRCCCCCCWGNAMPLRESWTHGVLCTPMLLPPCLPGALDGIVCNRTRSRG